MFRLLWDELLHRPLYNALIGLTSVLPFHDLGFAIIILTVVIRLILYIPSRNALKSQAELQKVQPKINEIREKYKTNPQKQAEETMKLYKEHGVNPMGSCLPLLVQFPVLIALFYVFQNGMTPEDMKYLYEPLKSYDFSQINVMFLGFMDLLKITPQSRYLMPFVVGGLQFYQMWLLNKQQATNVPQKKDNSPFDPQATQRIMMYFMPVLVAMFATSYPAGLSLYWATSTAFSIVQQDIVFKKKEKLKNNEQLPNKVEETSEKKVKTAKKTKGRNR